MTERELAAIVTGIVTTIREEVDRQLAGLLTRTAALEARTVRDGLDGRPGVDGAAGATGRDGTDGRPGLDGAAGANGRDGTDGRDGRDGVSLTGALIDRAGHLLLTRSDGAAPIDVGRVTGDPGAPGPAGVNGVNGKDAALVGGVVLKRLDDRRLQFCWTDGTPIDMRDAAGQAIESVVTIPALLYRGVWSGAAHDEGDVVTHEGSLWIAKTATTSRPGMGATSWQLAVKRGAQGKQGDPGVEGRPGRDLTQMDLEGRKW